MSSRVESGHDNLLIPLRWSPGITGLHLLVGAGAVIAIILDQWFNLWLKAFLSLAVTLSVADSLYRQGLRLHPDTVQALSLSSGQWRVRQRSGEWQEAEVLPGGYAGHWFIVARFRLAASTCLLVLSRDSIRDDQFRRCYVRFRYEGRSRYL